MSPRRTSRAGREAWAVQERRRRVTQFRVAELAVVLALLLVLGCVTISDLLQANNKVLAESAPINAARRVD